MAIGRQKRGAMDAVSHEHVMRRQGFPTTGARTRGIGNCKIARIDDRRAVSNGTNMRN
jgi:hypothetical protein